MSYRQVPHFFKQMLSVCGWPYLCRRDGWQILPCLEATSGLKIDRGTLLRGKGLKASLMQMIWTRVKGQGRVSSRQAVVSGERSRDSAWVKDRKSMTRTPWKLCRLWSQLPAWQGHQHPPVLFSCPIVVGKGSHCRLQELLTSASREQWGEKLIHHNKSHRLFLDQPSVPESLRPKTGRETGEEGWKPVCPSPSSTHLMPKA